MKVLAAGGEILQLGGELLEPLPLQAAFFGEGSIASDPDSVDDNRGSHDEPEDDQDDQPGGDPCQNPQMALGEEEIGDTATDPSWMELDLEEGLPRGKFVSHTGSEETLARLLVGD
jgi:hypothetical protein